jgi:hypothetical protein
MKGIGVLALAASFGAALFSSPASAGPIDISQLTDPATLHIGPGSNTSCATGGCPIFIGGALNGEVNNISPTQLDIYQNSNGAPALANPVLLILGVPNNSVTLNAGTLTGVQLYSPYPGSPTTVPYSFGTTAYGVNAGSGFAGLMTSGQEVYSFLGISGADHSNSFTNWSAAELRMMGVNVSDFGIYAYALDTSGFSGNDLLNIDLSGIPEGTFAVAFGANTQHIYDTPFTEAGLNDAPPVPQLPEPSTLALFGGGLCALFRSGLMRRRRRA